MFTPVPQLSQLIHMQIFLVLSEHSDREWVIWILLQPGIKGKYGLKYHHSVKINFEGKIPENVSSKDIILNLLKLFGANSLLGYSIEIYGTCC